MIFSIKTLCVVIPDYSGTFKYSATGVWTTWFNISQSSDVRAFPSYAKLLWYGISDLLGGISKEVLQLSTNHGRELLLPAPF
jgi:hypothetical protein